MKLKLLSFFILCLFNFKNICGQTILNPGFENMSAPSCAYNLSNSTFNGYVMNVTAFGTYGNCDIMDSTCGYGFPQEGNHFIGLSVPPGGIDFDAIAVEIAPPLLAGHLYAFSFYQKKDVGYASNTLDIGYSTNDSTMGSPAAALGAVTSTTWSLASVTFIPAFNASYITIRVSPTVYGWNHIDNLQLNDITSLEEERPGAIGISIFPNPANHELHISSHNFLMEAGDKIYLTDALGKNVFAEKIISPTLNFKLQTSNFPNGIYFLSVQTAKEKVAKKIVVNH